MPNLFVARPKYDITTEYLYAWSEIVMQFARQQGKNTFDLGGEDVTRKNLERYLKDYKPEISLLNGHGTEDTLEGQNGEKIILTGENSEILANSMVFMRSCLAAKSLGKEILNKGAKCFIGYQESFIFLYQDNQVDLLNDSFAKSFLDSSNQICISLLQGKTPQEAHQDSLDIYNNILNTFSNTESPDSWMAPYIQANRDSQICLC